MIRDNSPFGYGPTWDVVKVEIGPRFSIVESGRFVYVAAEIANQFMADDSPKTQYIAFQSNGQSHFDPDDVFVLLYRIVGETKIHQMRGILEALLVKAWQLRFHAHTWLINSKAEPANDRIVINAEFRYNEALAIVDYLMDADKSATNKLLKIVAEAIEKYEKEAGYG